MWAVWLAATARAQEPSLDVQRFDPVAQSATYTLVRDADLDRQGRFGIGLTGDWSWGALRVEGLGRGPVVDHLVGGNVLLHGQPVRWMSIAAQVPVVQALAGASPEDAQLQQLAATERVGLGDTLFELAFAPVSASDDQPMSFTVGPRVVLPTGSRAALVGSGSVGLGATAAVAGRWSAFRFSANLGVQAQLRSAVVADLYADDEFRYGLGMAFPFARDRWEAQLEWVGAAPLARVGKEVLGEAWEPVRHAPMEGLLAFQHRPERGGVFFRVGGGAGLTPAFGSPDVRLFAALGWMTEPERREPVYADRDEDGWVDPRDPCPSLAEDPDGIEDDGCPEGDRDGDGIDDAVDRCPTVKEDRDGFEDGDGCPETAPEGPSGSTRGVLATVYFETADDTLDPAARAELDRAASLLAAADDVQWLEIRGHADERGGSVYNLGLSSDRAVAVKRYLVAQGVDPYVIRLVALGEADPAVGFASDDLELALNRRVHVVVVR